MTLEVAFERRLFRAWHDAADPIFAKIEQAVEDKDFAQARLLANELDLTEVGTGQREWIKYMLLSFAVWGAGNATDGNPSFVGTGIHNVVLDRATDQILAYLEHNGTSEMRDSVLQSIADAEGTVQKADSYIKPLTSFAKTGDPQLQLISSLNSSRMATWGFVAEADVRGETEYVLDVILDGRTSDFCRHVAAERRVFRVEDARRLVNTALAVTDPNELRTVQPWPKQTKEAIDSYREMSTEELVALGLQIPPFHPRPLSEDTEFLSKQGWKFVKDAEIGELCFSLNPKTNSPEWVPITNKVDGPAPHGRMVHFHSQNSDLLVTEYHQQLYQRTLKGKKYLATKTAGELLTLSKVTIPRTAVWKDGAIDCTMDIGGRIVNTKKLFHFLAYWISDGSCVRRSENSYQISIATRKYQPKARAVMQHVSGQAGYVTKGQVYCNDTPLGKFLLSQVGKLAQGKKIPEFVMNAPPEYIHEFLWAYLTGDGSTCNNDGTYGKGVNRTFYTTNSLLASQLGELIIKAGGCPSYRTQDNSLAPSFIGGKELKSNHLVHRIRWSISKTATFGETGKGTMELVPYEGHTYCISLATNFVFLVRRNGKCIWTGNCRTHLRRVGHTLREQSPVIPPENQVLPPTISTPSTFQEMGLQVNQAQVDHWNSYMGVSPVQVFSQLSGASPTDVLSDKIKASLNFLKNGDIQVMSNTSGFTFDPYTGQMFMAGDLTPQGVKTNLKSFVNVGQSIGASDLFTYVSDGDAVTLGQGGFSPTSLAWENIRLDAEESLQDEHKDVYDSLTTDQQATLMALLNSTDERNFVKICNLGLLYHDKLVADILFSDVKGPFSLPLDDQNAVFQAVEGLSLQS